MIQDSLIDFCGTQARIIGGLIEPWKGNHASASLAVHLNEVLPSMSEGCELLTAALPFLKKSLIRRHREESVLALGTKYHDCYRGYLAACESLLAVGKDLAGEGYSLPNLGMFEHAARQFGDFIGREVDHLPRIRPEALARSAAEYERGECQSAREFLDELRRRPR